MLRRRRSNRRILLVGCADGQSRAQHDTAYLYLIVRTLNRVVCSLMGKPSGDRPAISYQQAFQRSDDHLRPASMSSSQPLPCSSGLLLFLSNLELSAEVNGKQTLTSPSLLHLHLSLHYTQSLNIVEHR